MNDYQDQIEFQEKTKLYLPKYCILEAPIRLCNEVTESAKIYFGELAVLASKYNYIPYTDEQLAEMKGCDVRTIIRWHKELEKNGFIKRYVKSVMVNGKKCQWKKERKIYLSQNQDLKKDSDSDKNVTFDDSDKNVTFDDSDKNVGISNKTKEDTKNNNRSAAVSSEKKGNIHECLEDLEIPMSDKNWISERYNDSEVKKAVNFVKSPNFDLKTTLQQAIKWALKEKPDMTSTYTPEHNKKSVEAKIKPFCRTLKKGDMAFEDWCFIIRPKNVEIVAISGGRSDKSGEWGHIYGKSVVFDFESKNFTNEFMKFIKEKIPKIYARIKS